MTKRWVRVAVLVTIVGVSAQAAAEDPEKGDVALSAETSIDANADSGRSGRKGRRGKSASPTSGSDDIRLAIQARITAVNAVGAQQAIGSIGDSLSSAFVPIVAPGVRLLDQRLFLGLGLGFSGFTADAPGDAETSRSAFSVAPTVSYDVLSEDWGALSLGGWFTISSLGDFETCNDTGCVTDNNGQLALGLNLLAGIRGRLAPGLSIGGEFGWGFIDASGDAADDAGFFVHGLLGMLVFEASVGL